MLISEPKNDNIFKIQEKKEDIAPLASFDKKVFMYESSLMMGSANISYRSSQNYFSWNIFLMDWPNINKQNIKKIDYSLSC